MLTISLCLSGFLGVYGKSLSSAITCEVLRQAGCATDAESLESSAALAIPTVVPEGYGTTTDEQKRDSKRRR